MLNLTHDYMLISNLLVFYNVQLMTFIKGEGGGLNMMYERAFDEKLVCVKYTYEMHSFSFQ
jgi:hypothetical protein